MTIVHFTADTDSIASIDKDLKLIPEVLRFTLFRATPPAASTTAVKKESAKVGVE